MLDRSITEVEEEKKLFTEYKRIESFLKKQQQDHKRAAAIMDSVSDEYNAPPRKKRRKKDGEVEEILSLNSGGRGGRRDRGNYKVNYVENIMLKFK